MHETERTLNQGFKRAGDVLSGKAAGLGLFAAKKAAGLGAMLLGKTLLVIKALLLKFVVVIGFKFVLTAGIVLLSSALVTGAFRGASGAAGISRYRQAALDSIEEMPDRYYLERYVVPWGILEALDIAANDTQFTARRFAEMLAPIVEHGPFGIVKVDAWNGQYHYIYHTVTTVGEDGKETSKTVLKRIDYTESWDRLDKAISKRLNRPVSEADRAIILAMGVSGTFNEPDIIFAPVSFVPVILGEYAHPVAGPSMVTSPFGAFRIINGRAGIHRGLDIGAAMGTPLVAVRNVVVERVFWGASGGNMVVLRADDGMRYLYAHLQHMPRLVAGQRLKQGQSVGRVGSTGFSTGPHLHIEFILPDGTRLDPAPHLGVQ